jgi:hypothetical protein
MAEYRWLGDIAIRSMAYSPATVKQSMTVLKKVEHIFSAMLYAKLTVVRSLFVHRQKVNAKI